MATAKHFGTQLFQNLPLVYEMHQSKLSHLFAADFPSKWPHTFTGVIGSVEVENFMPSPELRRPLLAFGTAIMFFAIAGTKLLPLPDTLSSQWLCGTSWLSEVLRILTWLALSEIGRSVALLIIAAIAVLPLLRHRHRQVREFAVTLTALLACLIAAALRVEADLGTQSCAHPLVATRLHMTASASRV